MFDWDDGDQVGDSIWGEFPENEDNILPYPKDVEENILAVLGNYTRKQRNEEASTALRSTEQTSSKNDILGISQDDSTTFITSEELSAAQLDPWPDLPSLNSALGKEYNPRDSIDTHLMLDMNGTTNLDKIRVQLDSPSEMFANDKDDKESDSFLDCDWANIGDIEDLDKIFSGNDSIFGQEMVGNAGDFLSASSDVISSTVKSIPLPDVPLSTDQTSGYDSSSFHLDELSVGKETPEEKLQSSSQKRPLRSHKKIEEKGETTDFHEASAVWSCSTNENQQLLSSTLNSCTKSPKETFQSPIKREVRAPNDIGRIDSPNLFTLSGYGYTAYPFPSMPLSKHIHTKKNQENPLSVGYKVSKEFSKPSNAPNSPSNVTSRPLTMTPQEKIEKLRRRQQMQAMLAIQQQQQQFAHPSTGSESGVPQAYSPRKQAEESMITSSSADAIASKISSPEQNTLVDQEQLWKISTMIDDHSLEETIYYQLQDALAQLDIRIRLCIRDSLFRLARSAMERQNASDRSSTNKSSRDEDELSAYDETEKISRSSKWPDAETGTNPIDRTVAHLLFHRPSELLTRPVKDEIPKSPAVYDPAPDASFQAQACKSDDYTEKTGEMEMQVSGQSKIESVELWRAIKHSSLS